MPQIDFAARRDWFIDRIRAWPITILVHDQNQKLLGLALLNPESGVLDQFAVATVVYGTGTATSLMTKVKRISNGQLTLDVNTENHRAIRFYQREGFVPTSSGVNKSSGLRTQSIQWTADQQD
jgi:putative acetyltransferase